MLPFEHNRSIDGIDKDHRGQIQVQVSRVNRITYLCVNGGLSKTILISVADWGCINSLGNLRESELDNSCFRKTYSSQPVGNRGAKNVQKSIEE